MPVHSPAFRGLDPARPGGWMGRTTGGWVGVALGALAAAGAACVAYGVLIERHWYRLRQETVPALEPGQPPCTVLHLSDFHLLAGDTRRRRFLAELPALRLGRGARVQRLLRPTAQELPVVLPPEAEATAPARAQPLAGAGPGPGEHGLAGARQPARAARRPRGRGHERPAHPPGRPDHPGASRRRLPAPADRCRPQPLPAQPQRLRAHRLPARARRPHPRRTGPRPRRRRAGDQLRPAARARPRAVAL